MPKEFSARTRSENIKTLKTQVLDVLVIGGGIVGAGVIRDLALNGGIKAGLIEQGDFASGTSSATSQLVHGGFRYLRHDREIVKMSRKEREILLHIAPNLVKPLPLAILFYKGDPYPLTGIQLAAHYYNRLTKTDKTEKTKTLRDPQKIQHLLGPIATDTLKGCVVIWDSTADDARLTLATLKDAHQHGAVITNYVRFLDFANQPDTTDNGNRVLRITAEDAISGEHFEISARKIVSATGPWSDHVWRKDPSYDGTPRLIMKNAQGTHIVLPRCGKSDASGAYGLVISTHSEMQEGGKSRGILFYPVLTIPLSLVPLKRHQRKIYCRCVRQQMKWRIYLQKRSEFFQNKNLTKMLLLRLMQARVHSSQRIRCNGDLKRTILFQETI